MESHKANRQATILNIHDDIEVSFWSKQLGVTPAILKQVAAITSTSCLKMIEIYIQTNKHLLIKNSGHENI